MQIRLDRISRLLFVLLFATAPVVADQPEVKGDLTSVRGVKVLRVWGTPREAGFAHGYLLADQIVAFIDELAADSRLFPPADSYAEKVIPILTMMFELPAEHRAELEQILAGVQRKLGEDGTFIESLNRPLKFEDLLYLNAFSDLRSSGCSSFSAWGARCEGGAMITGRNLDYIPLPALKDYGLVIVYAGLINSTKRWVSITWPGMVGCYTGVNEDGVIIAMHDVEGIPPSVAGPYTPRSCTLRLAMEAARDRSAVDDVARVLRSNKTCFGCNVHVSSPFGGQENPAAVLEYDGSSEGQGVYVRTAKDNAARLGDHVLVTTNHHRKRHPPEVCSRYARMSGALGDVIVRGKRVDVGFARNVMCDASDPKTLHSVVFLPNKGEFFVGFADGAKNAAEVEPVKLALDELFRLPGD